MALNSVLLKQVATLTPTISPASVANGAGRISAQVDNSTTKGTRARIGVKVTTGTSPTANALIRFYIIRNTTNVEGGDMGSVLGTADAAVATEPVNAECIGTIQVSATSNVTYREVFLVQDPGPKFSIVYWNASGVALNATAGNFGLDVEIEADEVQ